MATVTLSSLAISNIEATPRALNNAQGRPVQLAQGHCTLTSASAPHATSTMNFCQVPSNALITSIRYWVGANGAAGGTTTSFHLGAWSPTAYGGGVIDNDCFATAVTASAVAGPTDIVHEAGVSATSGINGMEKRVWQVAGLSSDPGHPIDIKGQLSGACDSTASETYIGVRVEYVI